MRIRYLLVCVALIGSGAQGISGPSSLDSAYAVRASPAVGPRAAGPHTPSDEALIQQGYPWRLYRRYPPSIRPQLRRADLEHSRCNTYPADNSPACIRMDRIVRQLERRGWCWGSELPLPSEAEKHWLRCSNDPHYRRANEAAN